MKIKALICGLICLAVFTNCKKDDGPSCTALKEQTKRTILTYMFQDSNLWEHLFVNINDMERGWNPETDGTMLVYVDASTHITQFGGKPVLLEITHDETDLIVSKVVKVYPDTDPTNTEVFVQVQRDAIEMYPAESYGLVFSGHGNGFFVDKAEGNRGLGTADRWSQNTLNVDVIAKNAAVHYDFIIFDACLMGESATLYQLRNVTDFVVASVELSAGDGFGFRSDIDALYTQPKADLYTFTRGSMNYYLNTEQGKMNYEPDGYLTIGVYRMSAMEELAAATKQAIESINKKYSEMGNVIHTLIGNPKVMESSMRYPADKRVSELPFFYDMNLLCLLLISTGDLDSYSRLGDAISNVVIQSHFAFSEQFLSKNEGYPTLTANISFYIPTLEPDDKIQDNAFYTRFEWSAASGFTSKWE